MSAVTGLSVCAVLVCKVTAPSSSKTAAATAVTARSSIDPTQFLHEQRASASPDLLRSMLTTFINTLMSAEAGAVCGALGGLGTVRSDWATEVAEASRTPLEPAGRTIAEVAREVFVRDAERDRVRAERRSALLGS